MLDYPEMVEERLILDRMVRAEPEVDVQSVVSTETVLHSRKLLDEIHLETALRDYIVNLVDATRHPAKYGLGIGSLIRFGAFAAGFHLSRPGREGRGVAERPPVRDSPGCESRGFGCAPPPRAAQLRSRCRGRPQRADHPSGVGGCGSAMNARELARRVRLTELRGRKVAGGVVSGAYHTAFKGPGHRVSRSSRARPRRRHTPSIDWNVTARMGRPHLKRFAEEREQTVILMVDGSRSGQFGSQQVQKSDTAAEVYAVLASAACRNKDQTGAILFTSEVEVYIPPGRGESHVLRLIHELLSFEPKRKGTDIGRALDFLSKVRRRRSLVFLISDFQDEQFESPLRTAAKRQDLVALSIFDSREHELPDCGQIEMEDSGVRRMVPDGCLRPGRPSPLCLCSGRDAAAASCARPCGRLA